MADLKKEVEEHKTRMERLRIYICIVAIAAGLAMVSFLIVPNTGTVGGCERLLIGNNKNVCLGALAFSEDNASVCGYITGTYKDTCYMQVAQESGNSTVCASIQNVSASSSCLNAIASGTENYTVCEKETDPYASKCMASIAVKLNDASLCKNITDLTYSQICNSIIATRQAASLRSPALCQGVSNTTNSTTTSYILENATLTSNLSTLSGAGQDNSALLLLPNITYTARDFCYITLAGELLDSGLCTNVTMGKPRDLCTQQITSQTSNSTYNYTQSIAACSQLGSYAQQCIQAAELSEAVSTKNATMCAQLGATLSDRCYGLIAVASMNSTYCTYITNATEQTSCINSS